MVLKKQFLRKWRIINMDQWENDYIDEVEPGFIEFNKKSTSGDLHFGYIYADIDYRINENDDEPVIEFTFQGNDEGNEIRGRGKAKITKGLLEGNIYFHNGDESSFVSEPYK